MIAALESGAALGMGSITRQYAVAVPAVSAETRAALIADLR